MKHFNTLYPLKHVHVHYVLIHYLRFIVLSFKIISDVHQKVIGSTI